LHAIAPDRIGFKVIADPKGFRAIRVLQLEGIDCIATALFSVAQASIAATVGAFGICPFVSRARAIGMDPHTVISDIRTGYDRLIASGVDAPEIIAVSLHGVGDVELSIRAGADAVAMRYPLVEEMMRHPLSEKADALFAKNWANVKGEDVSYLRTDVSGVAE
jgi:transaldolase